MCPCCKKEILNFRVLELFSQVTEPEFGLKIKPHFLLDKTT